jgi:hypothetical protein
MALREKRHLEPFYSNIQIKISLITSHSNRRKTPLKEAVYARWCGYGEKGLLKQTFPAGVVSKYLEYILDIYSSPTPGGRYAFSSLYVLAIK